nr:MAG TPA: hypothetical protein [Caudoviricetes sp.]
MCELDYHTNSSHSTRFSKIAVRTGSMSLKLPSTDRLAPVLST